MQLLNIPPSVSPCRSLLEVTARKAKVFSLWQLLAQIIAGALVTGNETAQGSPGIKNIYKDP